MIVLLSSTFPIESTAIPTRHQNQGILSAFCETPAYLKSPAPMYSPINSISLAITGSIGVSLIDNPRISVSVEGVIDGRMGGRSLKSSQTTNASTDEEEDISRSSVSICRQLSSIKDSKVTYPYYLFYYSSVYSTSLFRNSNSVAQAVVCRLDP